MQVSKLQMVKRFMLLIVAFTGVSAAFAANRLYIEDFSVDNYNEVTVPVMFESDGQVTGFTCELYLPGELSYVSSGICDNRTDGHFFSPSELKYDPATGLNYVKFLCINMESKTFKDTSGPIMKVVLKPVDGAIDVTKDVNLTLDKICMTTASAEEVQEETKHVTTVSLVAETPSIEVSATETQFVINPSGSHTVTLALDNEVELASLQLNITLPAGFTIKGEGNGDFHPTERVSATAYPFIITNRGNGVYNVIIADISTNHAISGTSGDLFSFDIAAPADFTAETATIVIDNVNAAPVHDGIAVPSYDGTGCTIKVVNGKIAYDNALAEVQSLRDELTAALAEIATAAPDVKDDFTGAEITAAIDDFAAAIDEAYANATLTDNYNDVMAPAAGLHSDIAKLSADAKAAQAAYEAKVAEDAAKAKADAEIAALKKALEDALAEIATAAPDVKDDFTGAEITAAIATLEKAVDAAYAEGRLAANYDGIMTPAAQIKTDTAQLIADAKAAQAAFEAEQARKAANDAAYNADLKTLDDLQAKLNTVKADLAALNPDYDSQNDVTAIQVLITNARIEAKTAYDKVAAEGNYAYTLDSATIEAMIDQLYAKSAANCVDALDDALKAALAEIAAECPNVKALYTGTEIAADIADLKADAEAAAADGTLPTDYASTVNTPAEEIEAAIAKLIEDAKAAQAEFEHNEELRQEANEAAHKADITALDNLQSSLDKALADIASEYPDADITADKDAIQKAIDDTRAAADKALDDVKDEGAYTSPLDEEAISKAIEDMTADAKAAQEAHDAEEARQEANDDARQADIDAVNDLQTLLDEALEEIAEKYPDYDATEDKDAIQQAIDDALAAIEEAYDAVADEGEYTSPLDEDAIKNLIDQMLTNAAEAGVGTIYADEIDGETLIYTLDGTRHTRPVKGMVNILVKDGSTIKVYVK